MTYAIDAVTLPSNSALPARAAASLGVTTWCTSTEVTPFRSHIYMYATVLYIILILASAFAGPVLADTDPSLSEVYEAASTGDLAMGRQELNIAESLQPGLPFATGDSVRALQTQLSRGHSVQARPTRLQTASSSGWWALAVVVVGIIVWFVFPRRRSASNAYSQPAALPGTAAGAGSGNDDWS
jgi:hypothetical protein